MPVGPSFLLGHFWLKLNAHFGWVSPHVSSLIQSSHGPAPAETGTSNDKNSRVVDLHGSIDKSGLQAEKKTGSWGTSGLIYSGYNIFLQENDVFFGGNLWFLSFWIVSFLGFSLHFLQ